MSKNVTKTYSDEEWKSLEECIDYYDSNIKGGVEIFPDECTNHDVDVNELNDFLNDECEQCRIHRD